MFSIALVCQKGGAGKTTLALHLAVEAQRRGVQTLVVDLDAQASAAKILDRRGEAPPDVATEHPGRLEQALAAAQQQGYGLVVIDTAPHADQGALRAARAADLVVIPVRPSIVDVDAVQTSLDICALAKVRAMVVLNAVSPQGREGADARQVISERGGTVASATLGDRKAFRVAFNVGQAAQEIEPRGKAAAEITALFAELNIPTELQHNKRTCRKVGV